MNTLFTVLAFVSLALIPISFIFLIYAFFRKKAYRPRLIFVGCSIGLLVISTLGGTLTMSPEQRADMEQKRIAKQAQEVVEKKQKAEQDAKAKEQDAADAAAQTVYDDQAKYEAWLKSTGIVGTIPGLGDKISVFEQKHKRSSGNDPDSYDDNLLSVMKDEGRILFITVNAFGRSLDPDVIVTPLLPTDGVRISSSDDRSDKYNKRNTFVGHSDILEIVIPESKGYYTRMDVYDIPTGDYLYTTVFTGKYDDPDTM